MPEEKSPKKKAARKSSVRKKSAQKKKSPSETTDAKAPSIDQEQSLPLLPASSSSDPSAQEQTSKKERKPKSGVRDVRKESPAEEKNGVSNSKEESESNSKPKETPTKPEAADDRRRTGRNRGRRGGSESSKPRPPVDGMDLKKKAWKIFLSEVTEEGLALLDDQALRAYARGSFNAARIYLEEELKVD